MRSLSALIGEWTPAGRSNGEQWDRHSTLTHTIALLNTPPPQKKTATVCRHASIQHNEVCVCEPEASTGKPTAPLWFVVYILLQSQATPAPPMPHNHLPQRRPRELPLHGRC